VVHADDVTCPVLIFHNKDDAAESAGGALEMFISLRRLGKRAWWLEYDKEVHTVHKINNLKDFTIRFSQFFDHSLKSAPIPNWMSEGIPFKQKGIASGYDLNR
jgi:dipeptidyl aminopeptidase/acylaminoacyl peptidase